MINSDHKNNNTIGETIMTIKLGNMKAVDLHRIMANAIIFASTDETIPSINMVRVEFTGTDVLAVTTDRFRMGVSHAVRDGGDDLDLHIPLDDAKSLARTAKCLKAETGWRTVDIEYDAGSATFRFNNGKTQSIRLQDSEFPKWRQLFPGTGSGKPRATTAFTADYLASFGKVDSGDIAHRIIVYTHDDKHGRGQKPITVHIGADFVGLIMPVKLENEDDPREWHTPVWMG